MFFKVKALSEIGVKVHLHCFHYGRPKAKELDKLCASVHYYPRHTGKHQLFNSLPYVVVSRRGEALVVRWLLNFVSRRGYALFGWWRIIVGSAALVALLVGF